MLMKAMMWVFGGAGDRTDGEGSGGNNVSGDVSGPK